MSKAPEPGTEPFRRELARPEDAASSPETRFERARGIDRVELRSGLATVHVGPLAPPFELARLDVLRRVAGAGVSLDFLKLDGPMLSFVVADGARAAAAAALEGFEHQITAERCVVLAHAANMRDEEGLIARIISRVTSTGAQVDHIGDMHDRVLVVTGEGDARLVVPALEAMIGETP
jgi:aspartokinase